MLLKSAYIKTKLFEFSLLCTAFLALTACSNELKPSHSNEVIGQLFDTDVRPFLEKRLVMRDGVSLAFHVWKANSGNREESRTDRSAAYNAAIVFLTGLGESYVKYFPLIQTLVSEGYTVYSYDHRSQGFSDYDNNAPQIAHVQSFAQYEDDLREFMSRVVAPNAHGKVFLMAHSMGAGIALSYAIHYPKDFSALALSAPVVEFQTGAIPMWVGYSAVSALSFFGLGHRSTFAGRDCEYEAGAQNICTHNVSAALAWAEFRKNNPQIVLKGASNSWVKSGMEAGWRLLNAAPKVAVPVLFFQAGNDSFAKNESQNAFCEKASSCEKVVLPQSSHEVFFERSDIKNPVVEASLKFFQNRFALEHRDAR
jgi:lysophospholipase